MGRPKSLGNRHLDTMRGLELERQAVELRIAHKTIEQIAEIQGCAISTAFQRLERAVGRLQPTEKAEHLRQISAARLDGMLEAHLAAARIMLDRQDVDGFLRAGAGYLRFSERHAKLLGLDAPTRVDYTISDKLESEIESLVDALAGNDPALEPAVE